MNAVMFYENDLMIGPIFIEFCFLIVCKSTPLFFVLFRYQVRKLKGAFQRAYGIHAGAALVKVCCSKKQFYRLIPVSLHLGLLYHITCSHWSLSLQST